MRHITRLQQVRVLFTFLMLMAAIMMMHGIAAGQESKASEASPAQEERLPSAPSIADLSPLATELAERSVALEKQLSAVLDLSEAERRLAYIAKARAQLHERLQGAKATEGYGYDQLAELKALVSIEGNKLQETLASLTEAVNRTALWEQDWLEEGKRWKELRSSVPKNVPPKTVQPIFARAQAIIDRSLGLIKHKLESLLPVQQQAGEIQVGISSLVTELDSLLLTVRGDVWRRTAPSMFSSKYYSALSKGLWEQWRTGLTNVSWPGLRFFERKGWLLFLQVVLSLALAAGILRHRRLLEQEERWRFVARRPLATGVFVACFIFSPLYGPTAGTWRLTLTAVICIPLALLAGDLFVKLWRRRLVYGLAVLLLTTVGLRVFNLPLPLFRLYVFFTATAGLVLCAWRALESYRRKDSPLYTWSLRLGSVMFLGVIVAEIGGYSALAVHALESSLKTTFIALAAWMLMLMVRGVLEWVVRGPRLKSIPFLQSKAKVIVSRSALLINFLIGAFCTTIVLVAWRMYESPLEAVQGLLSFGFAAGSRQITVGLIITAAAFLYGSLLVSWAVQTMLMEGVFTRRQLQVGVRISIARLIHYGFVFLGFILALVALGVQLRDLTIIAGALGVGIGFGLQGIVNNFVSGLILLFERPIKVGDYIQLGERWAEIKKIGLRATVVETFDRSEVVVPNSELVSSQVVNWTLSSRLVRITIPVGVAYGSDVPLVMQTLMDCANANPLAMRVPAPQVLFMAFGESSLDFQLRFWISDADNRRQAQSEVHQEIDRRFRESRIEIAFPQRDLHLRSMEESAAAALRPDDKRLRVVPDQEGGEGGQ